jgi:hypothetical protein
MLANPKKIKKLERRLSHQELSMNNLPEIIRTTCKYLGIYRKRKVFTGLPMRRRHIKVFKERRLAAKAVIRNYTEADSIRFEYSKKEAVLTRELFRKDRSRLWTFRGVKLFRSNRSREFWQWLKNSRTNSIRLNSVELKDEDGILHTDQETKLEIANKFYAKLASESNIDLTIYNKTDLVESPIDITQEEFLSALKKCGNNKAAGPDEIPAELYKSLLCNVVEENLVRFMIDEFNKYICGGNTPEYWSMANVIYLHKKGDETDLNNYRGISLINTISKIYLKIVNDRLTQFVEESDIISRYQAGFRGGEECMNQITSLLEVVRRREFKGDKTLMCFIDFEKAYDNVSHDLLFKKLEKLSIPKYLINTIKDTYKNTTMRIKIDGETSSGYSYRKGGRQGCPCSQMLVNSFINDIFEGIEGVLVPKSILKSQDSCFQMTL